MQFRPYTSTRTFRSSLSIDECLRRLHQETSVDSPVLPIQGWKPLALNKYIMRKVEGQQFQLKEARGLPAPPAPWTLQGEIQLGTSGIVVVCHYGLSQGQKFYVCFLVALLVAIIGWVVYLGVVNRLMQDYIIIALVIILAVGSVVSMFIALPARAHARLETEYYTAVQQLFDAEETQVNPV